MHLRLFSVLAGALLALSGCGIVQNLAAKRDAKRREKAAQEEANSPEAAAHEQARLNQVLGGIAYVHAGEHVREEEQYVLIRPAPGVVLPPGTVLECRGTGTKPARVAVTRERIPPYVAADIVSGEPARGDSLVVAKGARQPDPRLVPVRDPGQADTAGNPQQQQHLPDLPPLEPLPDVAPSGNPGILTEDDVLGPRGSRPPAAGPDSPPSGGSAKPDRR